MARIAQESKKNKPVSKPKESFTGGKVTIFGGAGIWRRLIEKLKVKGELGKQVGLAWGGRRYELADLLMAGIWAHICELGRPYHTRLLRLDEAFLALSGMEGFPSQSVLSRWLGKVNISVGVGILAANRALLMKVRDFRSMRKITLDLDTHVTTCYGKQQRAAKGYNPKKQGRKSYNPMFCFIGETRDLLYARMRGGKDCHVGKKEAVTFVKESLRGIGLKVCQVYLRADSAFYSKEFMLYLEKRGIFYAIVVRLYPGIQKRLVGLEYEDMGGGLEVGEFQYRAEDSKESRRMVVIRQKIREGEKRRKQLKLFENDGYDYQCIVTNLSISGYEVWKFYNGRCNAENMIKEGVYDYGLDEVVSHHYAGNACWLYLSLLAYNLTNWLKDIGFGEKGPKRFTRYFRDCYLRIGARMTRSGREVQMKMSSDHPYREKFLAAIDKVQAFNPVC